MEEETNGDEISEEDSPPSKRRRTETMVLDDEETKIASGLRPIPGISRAVSHFAEDETQSQDGGDSGAEKEEGPVDDLCGDGLDAGFKDNGVCL